jgi:predicted aspartyl protease
MKTFWLLLGLSATACATDPSGSCALQRVAELPLHVIGNVPLVTADINGRPANLVLDTGSNITMLNRAAADRLGVSWNERQPVAVGGAGGAARAFTATLPELALNGAATANVHVLVGQAPLPPLDGVLGINVLIGYEVDLDVPHRRATLYRARPCPAALPPWTTPFTRLPVQQQQSGHLFVPGELDDQPVFGMLDTGASFTTVGLEPARDAGVTAAALQANPARRAQSVNESGLVVRQRQFRTLKIGNDVMERLTLHVADLPPYAGELIIGGDYLATRRIWLSLVTGQVFVAADKQL